MGKDRLRRIACWTMCSAALLLHGCGVFTPPGYDFAGSNDYPTEPLPASADPNAPPAGVITPITPSLVRAQAQALSLAKRPPAEIAKFFGEPQPYTIGPSDIISVVVYDHPELQPGGGGAGGGGGGGGVNTILQSNDPTGITGAPGFIVDREGYIFYPYIRRIKVGGLTETEAAELIASRIKNVIKDPQVTVRIASFRSRRAYVEGEVHNPGTQIFTDVPMTLTDAINRAGGITASGDRSYVSITRGDVTTNIDLMQLQEAGVNPNKILLQTGDVVYVHNREDRKVYVMGEVVRPSALPMRNGRMTLNEAIAVAGGPNLLTANTAQVYVIRNVPGQDAPAVYHLDANNPITLALAEVFPLKPSDVVYIDPVPLVEWNRIINLILPSAQAITSGRNVFNP